MQKSMVQRGVAGALLAGLSVAFTAPGLARQQQDALHMRAVRWYAPASKQTTVLALISVPYTFATPIGTGPTAHIAYEVRLLLADDQGTVLKADTLPMRHAPATLRVPGAAGMEELRIPVLAGKYHLRVTVVDSATGNTMVDSLPFAGYASAPEASDLLLASSMRLVPPDDTTSLPGETARGAFRFVTAPVVRIDLTRPNMAFMLEAYPAQEVTSTLTLSVLNPDGSPVAVLPTLPPQKVPAGGGVLKGQFSLEGLPSGDYLLKASLKMGGQTIDRQTPFTVTEAEAALATSMALTAASRGIDEAYFNSLPEDSLDAMAEVLPLTGAKSRDLAVYKRDGMTLQAKRRFLIDFWQQRDQNKATPENETRLAFYARVAYANDHYSERGRPGWKTDRGRVFSQFGVPIDSLSMPPGNGAPAFLVWKYESGKPLWFIFADRTNSNAYLLLKTNATEFPAASLPVVETLTLNVTKQIASFLGLDQCYFYRTEVAGSATDPSTGQSLGTSC